MEVVSDRKMAIIVKTLRTMERQGSYPVHIETLLEYPEGHRGAVVGAPEGRRRGAENGPAAGAETHGRRARKGRRRGETVVERRLVRPRRVDLDSYNRTGSSVDPRPRITE